MRRTAILLAGVLVLPTLSAFAADPASITAVEGDAKVGREGAWRSAAPGATISEAEFLTLSQGAKVTVKLPDGTSSTLEGRAVIPGRRLVSSGTKAGNMVWFTKSVQKASEAIVGEDQKFAKGGSDKAGNIEKASSRLGGSRSGGPRWASSSEPTSTAADFAEAGLRREDFYDARSRARAIVEDPNATAIQKRRAHLVLGQVAASEGSFSTALEWLERAAAKPGEGEDAQEASKFRAIALSQLGQIHLTLGNEARAVSVLDDAIAANPASPAAAQANFFLGVLAAEKNDSKRAKEHFSRLTRYQELAEAAQQVLKSLESKS